MKLSLINEEYEFIDDNRYYAYHVTNSFHIVKKIFKKGFRTPAGIKRICFSDKPWTDFGIYVIKVIARKDGNFSDSPESGACPSSVKPIRWGFIFDQTMYQKWEFTEDEIFWVDRNPSSVNLSDFKELVEKNAVKKWQIDNWEKDANSTNENDSILDALLTRGHSYDMTDINIAQASRILELLFWNSLVEAFKKSKMKIGEFRDYLEYLMDKKLYSWDDEPL